MLEETRKLIQDAQNGSKTAGDKLIKKNAGLIFAAAKRFLGRGTDVEDLFQIGAIGFIKAVNRFDTSYNVELSTYAVPMIIGEIKRFLRDDGMIKVSRTARENGAALRRMRIANGDTGLCEAAKKLGISYEDALYALEATAAPESIDKNYYDAEGNGVSIKDIAASDENVEEEVIKRLALKNAIDKLDAEEREIIILRFYREMTQSKTAQTLGMSQVQVSRKEKRIMEKMRLMLIDNAT